LKLNPNLLRWIAETRPGERSPRLRVEHRRVTASARAVGDRRLGLNLLMPLLEDRPGQTDRPAHDAEEAPCSP
jgi:hypothetical protein